MNVILENVSRLKEIGLVGLITAAVGASPAMAEDAVSQHRAALADKDANPALLVIDQGEALFKTKRGPKNASLEKCDFGLGPGMIKGATAKMPRYFADTDRVQDTESRLVTCMVSLQGFDEKTIKSKTFGDQRDNEGNTDIEAIAAYVQYQSNGMAIDPPSTHPKEKEAMQVGENLFWRRNGPLDLACGTCHAEGGKRVRLQPLLNALDKKQLQDTMASWPTYRISHGMVRTIQHRMWDCGWAMKLPDLDYGSPASVALISYLSNQAKGAVFDLPGMKR